MRALATMALMLALASAGCAPGESGGGESEAAALPGSDDTAPFAGIGEDERLSFTGTEPFWGGTVERTRLVYRTPEQPDGVTVAVERFAGRGGLSFSGVFEARTFDMAVTPGACSDEMSDRIYPFTVTLRIGQELRNGCGWTDRQTYREPPPG